MRGALEDAVLQSSTQFYRWNSELEAARTTETEEKYRQYAATLKGHLQTCAGLLQKVWMGSSGTPTIMGDRIGGNHGRVWWHNLACDNSITDAGQPVWGWPVLVMVLEAGLGDVAMLPLLSPDNRVERG